MTDALFIPDGDAFVATPFTRGPWDERFQHAGPPSALLGRCLEALEPGGMRVARFTIEIPRPIPIGRLHVKTNALRTSKRTQLVEAVLLDGETEVAYARAWRMREEHDAVDATTPDEPTAPLPDTLPLWDRAGWPFAGYFDAIDIKPARGSFFERGPGAAWIRTRVPLVAGEEISPLSRVLVVADSGNGISSELDLRANLFINTELTVHLLRMPAGEWVLLDARTRVDGDGIGLTTSILSDEQVRIGTGAQSLLCARR